MGLVDIQCMRPIESLTVSPMAAMAGNLRAFVPFEQKRTYATALDSTHTHILVRLSKGFAYFINYYEPLDLCK